MKLKTARSLNFNLYNPKESLNQIKIINKKSNNKTRQ